MLTYTSDLVFDWLQMWWNIWHAGCDQDDGKAGSFQYYIWAMSWEWDDDNPYYYGPSTPIILDNGGANRGIGRLKYLIERECMSWEDIAHELR